MKIKYFEKMHKNKLFEQYGQLRKWGIIFKQIWDQFQRSIEYSNFAILSSFLESKKKIHR